LIVDGLELAGQPVDGFALVRELDADDIVALRVDGRLVDLSSDLSGVDQITTIKAGTPEALSILRHSCAHVLAKAVVGLFPGAKYATGPATDDGFFYDFDLGEGRHFDEDDLSAIEAEMARIIARDEAFVRNELPIDDAVRMFSDQPYKVEILERIRKNQADEQDMEEVGGTSSVSIYSTGDNFRDLCKGPHVPNTRMIAAFKLLRVSGAYWRGEESNRQLQRIYGTAFFSPADLENHLENLRQMELRDHRRIGIEQDWFHFPPEVGGGLAVFHPKGGFIRTKLEEFSRYWHMNSGYEMVWSPHIARSQLFEISGHLQWYKDGMYPPMKMEGQDYYPKPMNCPFHILIYRSKGRSYRELPLRFFELGTVYRFERSGTLHGLARVRGITQDDAHIFCTEEQLADELERLIRFVVKMLSAFGLTDFFAELSTRPEKSVGSDEEWGHATWAAEEALKRSGLEYRIAEGEGAFYAPKIDIHLTDAIGRRWQVSTLQVDLQLPQRFGLEFQTQYNEKVRPYMIHRALFGSVERFLAILIEHYAGKLPAWLLAEQVRILPVVSDARSYADYVKSRLGEVGARVTVADPDEPLASRIRKAKQELVPFILVVGKRDMAANTVGLTPRDGDESRDIPIEAAVAQIRDAIATPSIEV
jgi:threonyl-tRNA synthetase